MPFSVPVPTSAGLSPPQPTPQSIVLKRLDTHAVRTARCSKYVVCLFCGERSEIWVKVFPGKWHEETLASIQAVLRGEDMPAVGYDSDDDPEMLVNKRIKVIMHT